MKETEKKSELKETVVTTDNRSWIKRHKKTTYINWHTCNYRACNRNCRYYRRGSRY